MKKLSTLFFVCSILYFGGCSTFMSTSSYDPATQRFRASIDSVLSDSIFTATDVALKIVSLDNNQVLYDHNSKKLMRPASNLKILTTSTALCTLGKNFAIPTQVFYSGTVEDSSLNGDLYIKGYGDPDFSSDELAELVTDVKTKLGIKAIAGNIIGDASYFDDKRWGVGWMWDDEPFDFAAYNSALSINHNCVQVCVMPGKAIGDTAVVTIDPPTHYVSFENSAVTDTTDSLVISRKYDERLNVITVNGVKKLDTVMHKEGITVRGPELYFLTLAKEELEKQNVSVSGDPKLGTVDSTDILVTQHLQPIDSMIVFLNKVSDNLSAENTLKIIGAETVGIPGSTENGIHTVKRILSQFGVDSLSFLMVDGSGVSHYNLMTSENYIKILKGMYNRKDVFDLFFTSLPIAGVDGSLEDRMRNSPAQGNLHAKTGTISGVSTLAGYVRTADNELLAFSMMMQNFIGSTAPYRKAQDTIGILMAKLQGRK